MRCAQGRNGRSVDLEDIKFHQCVRLTEFDDNRQIVFTPPDGEFELMSYRLSQLELTPPFWVDCQVEHHGTSRVEFMVKIRSQFKQKVQAQSVEVAVPCPPDCQNPVTKQSAVRPQLASQCIALRDAHQFWSPCIFYRPAPDSPSRCGNEPRLANDKRGRAGVLQL